MCSHSGEYPTEQMLPTRLRRSRGGQRKGRDGGIGPERVWSMWDQVPMACPTLLYGLGLSTGQGENHNTNNTNNNACI